MAVLDSETAKEGRPTPWHETRLAKRCTMYRRRRPQREKIFFSFDSFLDVVANVAARVGHY